MLISRDNLESLSLGASLLGSGGGGSTAYGLMAAQHAIDKYGSIEIIPLESLANDALVVPLGYMGAPLIGLEKLHSDTELEAVLNAITKQTGKKPTALGITEIGGGNAFTPFYIAGKLGLPIVDGDLIGRAFPELQMISPTVHEVQPKACYMADAFGNTIIINCKDMKRVEKYARQMTVAIGSSSAIALHVFSGQEAKKIMIGNSVSRACKIGELILNSNRKQTNVIDALTDAEQCNHIGSGIVVDITQTIQNGFLQGSIMIKNSKEDLWKIDYQNEYLFAFKNSKRISETPDIIALLDKETGKPITSESITFGLRVDIISLRGPEIWYCEKGLELVGPKVFQ